MEPVNSGLRASSTKYKGSARLVADALLDRVDVDPAVKQAEQKLGTFHRENATDLLIKNLEISQHDRPMVYVSTPITGGDRLYDFLARCGKSSKAELSEDEKKAYNSEVIKANCEHAHGVADGMRSCGKATVEPSAIGVPGWTQTSYNQNWTDFIEKLPLTQLTACDGWELSYGCLLEARTALDRNIPVVDEHGFHLSRDAAVERVKAAVAEQQARGFNLQDLPRVLTAPLDTLAMEQG